MSTVTEFDHLGKRIVQVTFPAGTTADGLKAIFAAAGAAYARQPKGSILCLTVFDGFEVDEGMISLFEQVAKANVGTVKATAFVGVTGAQQALVKAMIGISGRDGKLCPSLEAAKDWLVSFSSAEDLLKGL